MQSDSRSIRRRCMEDGISTYMMFPSAFGYAEPRFTQGKGCTVLRRSRPAVMKIMPFWRPSEIDAGSAEISRKKDDLRFSVMQTAIDRDKEESRKEGVNYTSKRQESSAQHIISHSKKST
jgi:hypothetical protein